MGDCCAMLGRDDELQCACDVKRMRMDVVSVCQVWANDLAPLLQGQLIWSIMLQGWVWQGCASMVCSSLTVE